MAYEQRDNSGVAFVNAEKADPKHADFNGNITVNGQSFWLNIWNKKSAAGTTYLSVSVKPRAQQNQRSEAPEPSRPTRQAREILPDDDIPF